MLSDEMTTFVMNNILNTRSRMKKYLFLLMAMMAAGPSAAQQSLFNPKEPVVSPQIHADRTVTFRLFAPMAKEVQVTSDCLPVETRNGHEVQGQVKMRKDSLGVWSYTTPALEPELYFYWFLVDGVRVNDPQNIFKIRDVNTNMDIFLIGDAQTNPYIVGNVRHGTVSKVWYQQAGAQRRMTVYTPAGYEDSEQKYPVLYLLHGMGGDEEAWPMLGRATQILDNLIAQGKAEPMLVVMPNGNISQEAAPGEKAGLPEQPNFNLPRTMEGSYESSFEDIIRFVESHYRVWADKKHRAVAGLSMGGFHSFWLSANHPDWFSYIGLFSAAIRNPKADSPVYENMDGKLKALFAQKPSLYYIAIGNRDFLYKANEQLRAKLDGNRYPYYYHETDGGHIWRNWRIYLKEFTSMIFKEPRK